MLRKAIKEFKPDVIHFHWANPFPAAVLLAVMPKEVKLVIHWHMDIIKQKRIYPFIKPLETALLKRAGSMFTIPKMIEECEIWFVIKIREDIFTPQAGKACCLVIGRYVNGWRSKEEIETWKTKCIDFTQDGGEVKRKKGEVEYDEKEISAVLKAISAVLVSE